MAGGSACLLFLMRSIHIHGCRFDYVVYTLAATLWRIPFYISPPYNPAQAHITRLARYSFDGGPAEPLGCPVFLAAASSATFPWQCASCASQPAPSRVVQHVSIGTTRNAVEPPGSTDSPSRLSISK